MFDGYAWHPAPSQRPRNTCSLSSYKGTLWAILGHDNQQLGTNSTEYLTDHGWQYGPSLNDARMSQAAALFRGKIYVTGGVVRGVSTSAEAFDGEQWIRQPPMLSARERHAISAFNDRLYVLGGDQGGGIPLSSVEAFDGNTWHSFAPMPVAVSIVSHRV
eukprot:TRINITY_DN1187_c0_g1_i1.p1 TRINITY_DN1187_c0_g1~~TRINITY_DN1187_c0_g1_i1.p1  ORF type:complete len:160 (+),score=24.28 TRINITY_DN1187_c0_g1_i1:159-638(+)